MAIYNKQGHKYNFDAETLEQDLNIGARFWRWSLGNGQFLLSQRPDLQEAAGLGYWKQEGFRLKKGLSPNRQLRLINPKSAKGGIPEREGFESAAVVYDIRDTNANRAPWDGVERQERSSILNELAKLNGQKVIEAPFAHATTKEMEVSLERRLVGINKAFHEKNSSERFRFLVAAGIVLLELQKEIQEGDRVDANDNQLSIKAISCGAAYEICSFLGDAPPPLPMTAKKVLCAGNGLLLKEAHEDYAREQIKKIRSEILDFPA